MREPRAYVVVLALICGLGGTLAACSAEEPSATAASASPAAEATERSEPEGQVYTRGVDTEVTGRVTLLAPGSILVEGDDGGGQKAFLAGDTKVLDAQGGVCTTGPVPHTCTAEQLEKALEEGAGFHGKVTIRNGIAVQIEEIVRD